MERAQPPVATQDLGNGASGRYMFNPEIFEPPLSLRPPKLGADRAGSRSPSPSGPGSDRGEHADVEFWL